MVRCQIEAVGYPITIVVERIAQAIEGVAESAVRIRK
jgi:hypothetical protein